MSINPADYEALDITRDVGFQSARMGYPLNKGENPDHVKGWESFHKQRKERCKALGIPYRPPIRF